MRLSKDLFAVGTAFLFILAVIFGFIGKSIFYHGESGDTSSQTTLKDTDTKKYPSLPAEALRLKLSKNDPLEIIDLRPETLYREEHIPYSHHKTVADLTDYSPATTNVEVIIITLADDAVSMEQANVLLQGKSFPYAFLEGGIASWKALSGNMVSIGNPDSVVDRSKVSFKTAEETKTLIEGAEKNIYALIDVRSSSSYRNGHIPTAINIPLGELEQRKGDIPSGRQIIAYGADDLESFQAAVRLYDLNLFSPYAIENGFTAWLDKKYAVEK